MPADGVKVIDGTGKLALLDLSIPIIIFIRILPEIFRSCRREIFWAGFFTHTEHGENMEEEDVKAAARLATAELLMTGCTTSMDFMYFFPHGKHDLMDAEFEAVKELGLRFTDSVAVCL